MFTVSRLCLLLLTLALTCCVTPGTPALRQERARQLSHDLQQLSPTVNAREADRLATTAIEESAKLAEDFKPFSQPWMNNGLVNTGLRKRGLCYQWRDDLFPFLFRLNLKTLELHLTSSKRDTWLEPAAPMTAFRLIAPSTLLQLSGTGQRAFHLLSRLVRRVPAYSLHLGTDTEQIPRAITALLESLP